SASPFFIFVKEIAIESAPHSTCLFETKYIFILFSATGRCNKNPVPIENKFPFLSKHSTRKVVYKSCSYILLIFSTLSKQTELLLSGTMIYFNTFFSRQK